MLTSHGQTKTGSRLKLTQLSWVESGALNWALGMLLHYLGKLKIQIFWISIREGKQIAFLIASNFVIHPQILILSLFKIASPSPHWLQIKFSMSLFFYLFTFAMNLWHQTLPHNNRLFLSSLFRATHILLKKITLPSYDSIFQIFC